MQVRLLSLALFLCFAACAGKNPPKHSVKPATSSKQLSDKQHTQVGLASWYGGKFHGRKTASGERFNQNALTCAHRTLAFGTRLKVTNLNNGKSLVVRVNDRGPFSKNRLIDLSKAAAKKLGFLQSGLAKVEIEELAVR